MLGVDGSATCGQQQRIAALKSEISALPSLAGFGMGGSVSPLELNAEQNYKPKMR